MAGRMRAAVNTVVASQRLASAAADASRARSFDDAADRGDIPALLEELAADPEIIFRGNHSYSALHRAAERGHTDAVYTLLLHGADAPELLNARTSVGGNTPLHLAAQRGSIGVVRKLLKARALAVDTHNDRSMTAAQVAEYAGYDEIASLLQAPRASADLSPTGTYSSPRTPRTGQLSEGEPPLSPALSRLERDVRVYQAAALRSQSSELQADEGDGELSPTRQDLDIARQEADLRHSLAGLPGSPRRTSSNSGTTAGGIGARSRNPSRRREASDRWQLELSAQKALTDAHDKARNMQRLYENVVKGRSSSAGSLRLEPSTGFGEELRRHRQRHRSQRTALEGQRVQRKTDAVVREHAAAAPPSPMTSKRMRSPVHRYDRYEAPSWHVSAASHASSTEWHSSPRFADRNASYRSPIRHLPGPRMSDSIYRSPIRDLETIGQPTVLREQEPVTSPSARLLTSDMVASSPSSTSVDGIHSGVGTSPVAKVPLGTAPAGDPVQTANLKPVAADATSGSTHADRASFGVNSSRESLRPSAPRGDIATQKAATTRGDNALLSDGADVDTKSDRGLQRQKSRARIEQALDAAQKEGAYSHLMRSASGGSGFDARSKTLKLDAIGDGGAENLLDMEEVREALLQLAAARSELVALAAASSD